MVAQWQVTLIEKPENRTPKRTRIHIMVDRAEKLAGLVTVMLGLCWFCCVRSWLFFLAASFETAAGNSIFDKLDPYVIVKLGEYKRFQTPVLYSVVFLVNMHREGFQFVALSEVQWNVGAPRSNVFSHHLPAIWFQPDGTDAVSEGEPLFQLRRNAHIQWRRRSHLHSAMTAQVSIVSSGQFLDPACNISFLKPHKVMDYDRFTADSLCGSVTIPVDTLHLG